MDSFWSPVVQDRVLNHSKITVHMNCSIEDAYGNGKGQLAGLHVVEKTGRTAVAASASVQALWVCSHCVHPDVLPLPLQERTRSCRSRASFTVRMLAARSLCLCCLYGQYEQAATGLRSLCQVCWCHGNCRHWSPAKQRVPEWSASARRPRLCAGVLFKCIGILSTSRSCFTTCHG